MHRKQPWFKFWASDYLTDSDVDELSLGAQGLLVRMWCVCSQRRNIPDNAEEIARLTRCKLQDVSQYHPQCKRFFELRGGLLFSKRMEAEKVKSDIARSNAERRYSKEPPGQPKNSGKAKRSANGSAQKARWPESQIPHTEDTFARTATAVPAEIEIYIEVLLNDNSKFPVEERQVVRWETLYQSVDVRQELRNYVAWTEANLTKRKTRAGILRSINSWLAKAQNGFRHEGVHTAVGPTNTSNHATHVRTNDQENRRLQIVHHLEHCSRELQLRSNELGGLGKIAEELAALAQSVKRDKTNCDAEAIDKDLTAMEIRMFDVLKTAANLEQLDAIENETHVCLGKHRKSMRAEGIREAERQLVFKRLLELFYLPRLSLFYIDTNGLAKEAAETGPKPR